MAEQRILVVEDDELVRSFLTRALSDVAGEVQACATGAEAMTAAGTSTFAVILLDGLLPDIHGVDLARRLIGAPGSARSGICFVSGSLRRPLPMRGGITALPKPLRVRELVDAVQLLLAWREGGAISHADRLVAIDALAADLLVV